MPRSRAVRRIAALALGVGTALSVALVGSPVSAQAVSGPPGARADETALYLVTLEGPGTAGSTALLDEPLRAAQLIAGQDATLDGLGALDPIYRWTTALDGYAVRLSAEQADLLRSNPEVALVEPDGVRPLAGLTGSPRALANAGPRHGGAGTVIGLIDSGLAPESPVFAQVRASRTTTRFNGTCETAADWVAADCNAKVVGARWYVDGFGAQRIRATSSLSARDTDGHGTQMASIAAGNSGVAVRIADEGLGRFGGQAPDAQIAVYKACWSAPDPADDGCSTADLVAAIDQATADRVDVLGLAVGGPGTFDTVERALLGASEAGIVVAAAAGNGGHDHAIAHPGPWVTTVGATTGDLRRGRVVLAQGRQLAGAMLSRRDVGPAQVVLGADAAASGFTADESRFCLPGSLDAARVADAIVICRRGHVGRVDKSETVALADGAGMVLINSGRGSIDADAHRVPTVHLTSADGHRLVRWASRHPGGRIRLQSLGIKQQEPRVASFSAVGDPSRGVLKPDVVAPGAGVLGAVPAGAGDPWDFVSGTSAATAYVAGAAATLLSRRSWTAGEVRSALATTAAPVGGSSALESGAGEVRLDAARSPGLAYVVAARDYRAWLEGDLIDLNTPSAVLTSRTRTFQRTVTSVSRRRQTYTVSTQGFRGAVRVRPAQLRLEPGESATYTVTVRRRGGRLDDGYVSWRGSRGTLARIPVVLAR